MALSGSVSTNGYQGRYLTLTWSATQNTANNTSTISWTLKGAGNATSTWYMAGNFKVVIDGSTVYSTGENDRITLYNGTVVASGTKTLTHKDDGSRTFAVSIQGGIYNYAVNCTGSNTFTLNTIARASKPTVSASSVTMGSSVTIYTNRKSSSFLHYIRITFGDYTKNISMVGASTTWSVDDLASYIPNATSGTAKITCTTYTGTNHDVKVGAESCTITVKVPAATTPTLPTSTSSNPKYTGDTITISLPRKSTNFKHKLSYAFSNASGKIVQQGVSSNLEDFDTSASWTIPYSLCFQIPSAWSGNITITCVTYNGTAKVGTTTKSLYFKVRDNDTTKPKISGISIAPITSLKSPFNTLYIQGYSKVKATYTTSAPYSSLKSVSMTVQSKSVTGSSTTATSGYLSNSGVSVKVSFTITNARGQTNTGSATISQIHEYSEPLVSPLTGNAKALCYRSDSVGKEDTGGLYLTIKAQRKYWTVGGNNTCSMWYRLKVYNGLPFADGVTKTTLLSATATGGYDSVVSGVSLSSSSSYTVEVGVTDTIGKTSSIVYFIPTAKATFHLAKGGNGASFGGYSDGDGLLVPWKARFTGAVQGNAYGLGLLPKIPDGSDINTYTTVGVYAVTSNASALTMTNLPFPKAGRLIVSSSEGSGKTSGSWVYFLQEYITFDGYYHFKRMIYTGEVADEWTYNAWWCTSSTDWQDLGLSAGVSTSTQPFGRSPYSCAYRAVNENHVYVAFNCQYTFSGAAIGVNKFAIPQKYRPARTVFSYCPCGDRNIARVYVTEEGWIGLGWVQNLASSSYTTSYSSTWIDGYIDYWV